MSKAEEFWEQECKRILGGKFLELAVDGQQVTVWFRSIDPEPLPLELMAALRASSREWPTRPGGEKDPHLTRWTFNNCRLPDTCGGCRFFFREGGECRRKAPVVLTSRVLPTYNGYDQNPTYVYESDTTWPAVLPETSACGEFEEK